MNFKVTKVCFTAILLVSWLTFLQPVFGEWQYPVPTAELTTDANTAVLLHYNEDAGYPSATTATDSSGNGNNAVAVGTNVGYSNTLVRFGTSAALHTEFVNSSYFNIADEASLDASKISVEGFFVCNNSYGNSDQQVIITRNAGSANGGFVVYLDPLGDGVADVPGNTGAIIWASIAGIDLNRPAARLGNPALSTGLKTVFTTDTDYHHFALTYSGTKARLYLDGKLEDEKTSAYNGLPASTAPITIGGNTDWGIGFVGRIDEVRISKTDRTFWILTCSEYLAGSFPIPGDVNRDCYVNMLDIAQMVEDWLNCNNPQDNNCPGGPVL
ncbi:MAG: LamG domain-containing protein [Sedimentisphaerales bacterium]